eukprot:394228-Prymnesium_polylepis.1
MTYELPYKFQSWMLRGGRATHDGNARRTTAKRDSGPTATHGHGPTATPALSADPTRHGRQHIFRTAMCR